MQEKVWIYMYLQAPCALPLLPPSQKPEYSREFAQMRELNNLKNPKKVLLTKQPPKSTANGATFFYLAACCLVAIVEATGFCKARYMQGNLFRPPPI